MIYNRIDSCASWKLAKCKLQKEKNPNWKIDWACKSGYFNVGAKNSISSDYNAYGKYFFARIFGMASDHVFDFFLCCHQHSSGCTWDSAR